MIDPIDIDDLVTLLPQLSRLLSCPIGDSGEIQQLSMSQYRAMAFVRWHPDVGLSDVARELDISLGSASDLIDRLVMLGMIERRTHPVDRRQIQLRLTPEAERRILALRAERNRQLMAVKATLSEQDWQGFVTGLAALVDVLDESTPRKHDRTCQRRTPEHV